MRIKATVLMALAVLCVAKAARADYENRVVGNWVISAHEDRFGDGGTFVAATFDDSMPFAVRCLQKMLTFATINQSKMTAGDAFNFKFRVDRQNVVSESAIALDTKIIQIDAGFDLLRQMREGKELAVRMESARGVVDTHVINLRGASKALSDIARECPENVKEKGGPERETSPKPSDDHRSDAAPPMLRSLNKVKAATKDELWRQMTFGVVR